MAKKVIREWTELFNTYFSDHKRSGKRPEAVLLVNRCAVREDAKGKRHLMRIADAVVLTADTRSELEVKVGEYAERGDVRLLIDSIDRQDRDLLPTQTSNVSDDVIDGTAFIYKNKAE